MTSFLGLSRNGTTQSLTNITVVACCLMGCENNNTNISQKLMNMSRNRTSLALHLQRMHECKPCHLWSASIPPIRQARWLHICCNPTLLTGIDLLAVQPMLVMQASGEHDRQCDMTEFPILNIWW